MVETLTQEERANLAAELPGWAPVEGRDALKKDIPVQDL